MLEGLVDLLNCHLILAMNFSHSLLDLMNTAQDDSDVCCPPSLFGSHGIEFSYQARKKNSPPYCADCSRRRVTKTLFDMRMIFRSEDMAMTYVASQLALAYGK